MCTTLAIPYPLKVDMFSVVIAHLQLTIWMLEEIIVYGFLRIDTLGDQQHTTGYLTAHSNELIINIVKLHCIILHTGSVYRFTR